MICVFCEEQSQGPGCCEASLRGELWRLHSTRDGLRAAFQRRQTPELHKRLFDNTEDIVAVRLMLGHYPEQEPPRLLIECLKIPLGHSAAQWRSRSRFVECRPSEKSDRMTGNASLRSCAPPLPAHLVRPHRRTKPVLRLQQRTAGRTRDSS